MNVLELGSAHTTALSKLLGMAGIPGLLLGGEAQHSMLHLSKEKYLRGTGEGDSRMAKAKHLSKASVCPAIFPGMPTAQLMPGSSPCRHCRQSGESRRRTTLGAEALVILKFSPWKSTSCN